MEFSVSWLSCISLTEMETIKVRNQLHQDLTRSDFLVYLNHNYLELYRVQWTLELISCNSWWYLHFYFKWFWQFTEMVSFSTQIISLTSRWLFMCLSCHTLSPWLEKIKWYFTLRKVRKKPLLKTSNTKSTKHS